MRETPYAFAPWFVQNWSRMTAPMAAILIVLAPILFHGQDLALLLLYLQIPAYMIHQYEEHAHGKFKAFAAETFGQGQEVLNDLDLLWINVGLVWGVQLMCLLAAVYFGAAWGLLAAYAPLVNAVTHVAVSARMKSYNPGLWTSVLLFLPLGGFAIYYIGQSPTTTSVHHFWALGLCVALHGLIIGKVIAVRSGLARA